VTAAHPSNLRAVAELGAGEDMTWGQAAFIMTVGGALLLVGMLVTRWSRRHG
jgi:hypothetical protein